MAQKKFIIDGGFQTTDDSIISAKLEMAGHILPTVDSDGTTGFDLGSTTKKWRDLYLSQGSLYIDGQKVLESDSGTIVVQADVNQSLSTKVTGSGVLTLTSGTTVNMNGTLQMQAGKKITDVGGNAVTFGDKISMDSNRITDMGTATAATDGANKAYVDAKVDSLVNGAPGAMDTLNELAAALGDDADFAGSMTASLGLKAATTYVDTQDTATLAAAAIVAQTKATLAETNASADATTKANNAQTAAGLDATSKADAAELAGISHTNTREVAITTGYESYAVTKADAALVDAKAYADTAEADAKTYADAGDSNLQSTADASARTYTDAEIATAISTAASTAESKDAARAGVSDAYADASEAAAVATASSDATTKADAALVSAKAYADTAEADAISTASGDATTKANAATSTASSDATTKANAAQAAAISTASSDATTKANAAQAAAIASVTNGAGAAFDTLKEIQDAMATDTELSSAISSVTSSAASTASADATTKADAALAAAKVYADNGDANTTYTAGNGMSLSGTQFLMSGNYTGSFTATGDITAYSDDTLKTNVQVIDGALDRVEAIRGVTFERIEDGSVSTGVIAQELKAVLPEAVHTDAYGVHSVAYGNITGLLIEAVKELSAEVKELKNM